MGRLGVLLVIAAFSLLATSAVAGPAGEAKVIIAFQDQPGAAEEALVRDLGGSIKYTYDLVPAIAASLPEGAIAELLARPGVIRVERDLEVYAVDAELDNSWGVQRIGAGTVHDDGNKGTGIKVAIIDSGIDHTHSDLDDNYAGGYDFVEDDSDPMDVCGHGTHVAGTVGAEDDDDDLGVVGVAPEADIYGLRVLDDGCSGSYSDVIAALQWAVDNGIQVTNNSYGSSGDPGETVKAAFDNASAAGIIHAGAAGNSGNPPGRGENCIYPALWDSVIAVVATNKDDNRASFSSTCPEAELAGPGVDVNSTWVGGGYHEGSGTSMATPHVAGTAALVIASGISNNHEVRLRLQETADDLGQTGRDSQYGFGLVNAAEAAAAPVATGSIAGTVTNAADSTAISGATVTVDTGQSATTASDGTYTITDVPIGDRTVTASADGFDSQSTTVTVTEDQPATADFALIPTPVGSIAGTVTNADDGTAISGATVTVDTGQSATTGADGTYHITDVPIGDRTVTASADGFSSASQTVTVSENITITADFALTPVTTATIVSVDSITYATKGGRDGALHLLITIALLDDLGEPVSDASVSIDLFLNGSLHGSGTGTTGTDGTVTFRANNAPAGCYTTTVTNVTAAGLTWDGETPPNQFGKGADC